MALACHITKSHGSKGVTLPREFFIPASGTVTLETSSSYLADRGHTAFLWNAEQERKGNWRGVVSLV